MSGRYARMFSRLTARGEGTLGAFVMLGDPDFEASARLLELLVKAGADMLEVGVPFTDPVADGPVIQAAAQRALKAGMTPGKCFALIDRFRARHQDVPVGILTYANIIVARGRDNFYRSASDAGVDSILIADLPALEAGPFVDTAHSFGIDQVLIAARNTPAHTLHQIARLSSGYTYCVSRFGVTGARADLDFDHRAMLNILAEAEAPPPIMGFGISTSEHVCAAIDEGAAGVIVGSAIVRLIEKAGRNEEKIAELIGSLKTATLRNGIALRSPYERRHKPNVTN